jgi:hypothetical protein
MIKVAFDIVSYLPYQVRQERFMRQRLIFTLWFVLIALSSCQSYTSELQKSIARADDTAAIGALRAISIAQRNYNLSNPGEYGTLQQLTDRGLLDIRFGGTKPVKDYVLTLKVIPKEGAIEGSFTCNADPDTTGDKAGRHFFIDATSTDIHVNETQPATASDKILQ